MVDLSLHPDATGELVVKARVLDLVPGRSGDMYEHLAGRPKRGVPQEG